MGHTLAAGFLGLVCVQAVHADELTPLESWGGEDPEVIAIAAKFGDVRLIDNLVVGRCQAAVR